jgi:hypothetical protein
VEELPGAARNTRHLAQDLQTFQALVTAGAGRVQGCVSARLGLGCIAQRSHGQREAATVAAGALSSRQTSCCSRSRGAATSTPPRHSLHTHTHTHLPRCSVSPPSPPHRRTHAPGRRCRSRVPSASAPHHRREGAGGSRKRRQICGFRLWVGGGGAGEVGACHITQSKQFAQHARPPTLDASATLQRSTHRLDQRWTRESALRMHRSTHTAEQTITEHGAARKHAAVAGTPAA